MTPPDGPGTTARTPGGVRVAVDAVGGDVFRHRPTLRVLDWGIVAWRALRRSRGSGRPVHAPLA